MNPSICTKDMVLKLLEGALLNGGPTEHLFLFAHPDTTFEDTCGLRVERNPLIGKDTVYLYGKPDAPWYAHFGDLA